ncbi:MAG: flavin reductase family protein [Pseudomonadota bacterium]
MHYSPEDGHGLPHNPFKAIVSPRPIGWIGSLDDAGRANLAPYSFFNAVADAPPIVMFSTTGRKMTPDAGVKDSLANIRATGEFTVNVVGWELKDAMNASSGGYEAGEDEFDIAGLEKAASLRVKPPRVARAPAAFECVLEQEVVLPVEDPAMMNVVIFGRVVQVHIRDDYITEDGRYDAARAAHLARGGYRDYSVARELFEMSRPAGGDREALSARA